MDWEDWSDPKECEAQQRMIDEEQAAILAEEDKMAQVFVVATVTGYREQVQDKIRSIDPEAVFENAGNLQSFWVATKLTRFSLEAIDAVAQVFFSNLDARRLKGVPQN